MTSALNPYMVDFTRRLGNKYRSRDNNKYSLQVDAPDTLPVTVSADGASTHEVAYDWFISREQHSFNAFMEFFKTADALNWTCSPYRIQILFIFMNFLTRHSIHHKSKTATAPKSRARSWHRAATRRKDARQAGH